MKANLMVTALLVMSVGWAGAWAAGSTSSSTQSKPSSSYDEGVSAVKAGAYDKALRLLGKVVKKDPKNADAWNYIGFSHRKLSHYDEALTAYNKALAIDPKHRGAHEYLGELYLMMGDVAKAKAQLEKLKDACSSGCEEYDELEAAIAKHSQG